MAERDRDFDQALATAASGVRPARRWGLLILFVSTSPLHRFSRYLIFLIPAMYVENLEVQEIIRLRPLCCICTTSQLNYSPLNAHPLRPAMPPSQLAIQNTSSNSKPPCTSIFHRIVVVPFQQICLLHLALRAKCKMHGESITLHRNALS